MTELSDPLANMSHDERLPIERRSLAVAAYILKRLGSTGRDITDPAERAAANPWRAMLQLLAQRLAERRLTYPLVSARLAGCASGALALEVLEHMVSVQGIDVASMH